MGVLLRPAAGGAEAEAGVRKEVGEVRPPPLTLLGMGGREERWCGAEAPLALWRREEADMDMARSCVERSRR